MRFFLNNLKMMFNRKIVLTVVICFAVNVFYSLDKFPQVLFGVKNGFEIYTAIPWISVIFPFFLGTGAYFSAMDDISLFTFPKIKSIGKYYGYYYLTLIFSSAVYCLFYGAIAIILGGEIIDTLFCIVLLALNLLFISTIQCAVYSMKKNILLSIAIVLFIILASLIFPKSHFNIGAWGMLVRSNVKADYGFNTIITTVIQIVFTVICNAIIVITNKNKKAL